MVKIKWLSLLFVGIGLTACLADEAKEQSKEKVVPKPDLTPVEIVVPAGLKPGIGSQVKVLVDYLAKDSQIQGKVLVELIVISNQTGERLNYRAEVDAMKYKQKREVVFPEVRAPLSTRTVRLLAIVDPEAMVEEGDEDNNRRLYQIAVVESSTPAEATSPAEETPSASPPEKEASPPSGSASEAEIPQGENEEPEPPAESESPVDDSEPEAPEPPVEDNEAAVPEPPSED